MPNKANFIKGFFRGASSLPKRELRGYRSQGVRSLGPESLFLYFPTLLARKLLGPKKVSKAVWNYVQKPALSADIVGGKILEKIPVVGKQLFNLEERVPWGKGLHKTVTRPSAMAPLVKTRDIAAPLIVGVGLEKGLHSLKKPADMDGQVREKVAAAMLHLDSENKGHKKRAHALRLLYKQAELGYGHIPQTYKELEEKLASLMGQDLTVVEKALELTGGTIKLGELDSSDPNSLDATQQFQASVLGD